MSFPFKTDAWLPDADETVALPGSTCIWTHTTLRKPLRQGNQWATYRMHRAFLHRVTWIHAKWRGKAQL